MTGFAHVPTGQRDALPEGDGWAEGFGHLAMGVELADDALGPLGERDAIPESVDGRAQLGCEDLAVEVRGGCPWVVEHEESFVDEAPQRWHS